MKISILTFTAVLFITISFSNNCNAQTHRLLSKIEETKLGNNMWDKVTVQLPNKTYELKKVSYENNTILILFDYAKTMGSKRPSYFSFNLSDYNIDSRKVSEQATFQVVAKYKDSDLSRTDVLFDHSTTEGTTIGTFRCPVYCPF